MSSRLITCFFITILISLLSGQLHAQNGLNPSHGAYSSSLGLAGTAISGVHALNLNPAGLMGIKELGVQISSEQRFLIPDLTAVSLGVAKNFKGLGTFAFLAHSFGIDEFRQQGLGLSYARNMSKKLSLGLRFNYLQTRIEGYGSNGRFSFDLGTIAEVSRELKIAASLTSPLDVNIAEETDLNTKLSIGIIYDTGRKFNLLADISKEINQSERFHLGILYKAAERVDFKIGVATSPAIFTFGVGLNLSKNLRLDGASRIHQNLGNTPVLSISYDK